MRTDEKKKSLINRAFEVLDSVVFSAFLLLFILPYLGGFRHAWIVIPIYLFIVIAVRMIHNLHGKAYQKERMFQKKKQQQTERILLLSDKELSDRFGKNRFILIRKEHPDRFDIMEAIRKQADAIGVFSNDISLKELVQKYSPETTVYLSHDLLYALCEREREGKGIQSTVFERFLSKRSNRYFMLGILFLAASLFLHLKIYYRLAATACLIIASVSGILGHRKSCKNFLIFLDKMDD